MKSTGQVPFRGLSHAPYMVYGFNLLTVFPLSPVLFKDVAAATAVLVFLEPRIVQRRGRRHRGASIP